MKSKTTKIGALEALLPTDVNEIVETIGLFRLCTSKISTIVHTSNNFGLFQG